MKAKAEAEALAAKAQAGGVEEIRALALETAKENAKLREQLRAARKSLALAQEHPAGRQVTGELDAAEVSLLGRLLAPSPAQPGREDTGTG